MKRIRIGNDFWVAWQIVRGDMLEQLNLATDMQLLCHNRGANRVVDFELVSNSIIQVEVTPELANATGDYRFELSYILPHLSANDGNQKCRTDVSAFTIVPLTADADEITELDVQSDVLIGLRGAAFESKHFTAEEWAEIQRPAVEAAAIATSAAQLANEKAQLADDKAQLAVDATTNATNKVVEIDNMLTDWVQVESLIVAQEEIRVQAELRRDQKEDAMDAAELIRIQNDLERIGSVAGVKEFNEINIQ